MSVALPSPDGMLAAAASRSRGSFGFTVTGFVVALDGGVANGTFGCGEDGFAVGADDAAALASARGWATLQPGPGSATSDAATPPVMYETRFSSSRREMRPSA